MRRTLWIASTLLYALPAFADLPGFATRDSEDLMFTAYQYRLKVLTTHGTETVYGSGVWLGHGYVLTANHLFNHYQPGDGVRVELLGKTYDATLKSRGNLEDADLALLALKDHVEVNWNGPAVCAAPVPLNAPLRVISYDKMLPTFASPDRITYGRNQAWSEATTASMSPGVSGSPVIDGTSACLTGIISRTEMREAIDGGNTSEQLACLNAARAQNHASFSMTCSVTAPTRFSSLQMLREFLGGNGVPFVSK